MTDASVRVPEISELHDGREVDCEVITRNGINYYKQRTNAHEHYLDVLTGIYTPVTGRGGVPVSMDYNDACMRGIIPGASSFTSNGHSTYTLAVTGQPVHEAGAANISLTGVQLSFVSTSAQDSAAGTGIRTLIMSYIEHSTLAAKTEIIAMNGTTPVLTVATNIRFVNSLIMITAGTGTAPAGTITATNGGITYAQIAVGHKVQASSYRMVPAGKVFIPHEIIASSNSGTAAAQAVFHIVNWSASLPYWIPSNALGCQDASIIIPLKAGRPIPAGSVIGIEVTTNKGAEITAAIIGHLENA